MFSAATINGMYLDGAAINADPLPTAKAAMTEARDTAAAAGCWRARHQERRERNREPGHRG
jgi:hypothetical protein